MNNIFENAYFGKPYKTRDGRKAIYLFSSGCGVYCITEEFKNKIRHFHFNGIPYDFEFSKYRGDDIISEWQEEINEKQLDKLASVEVNMMNVESSGIGVPNDHFPSWVIDFAEETFKAGYRKAYRKAKGL